MIRPAPRGPVDLHNCEDEPIHIPGSIQAHGVLIAFDDDGVVRAVSANVADWCGVDADAAVGASLHAVLGPASADDVLAQLDVARSRRLDELELAVDGRPLAGALYRSTGWFVLELEHHNDVHRLASDIRTATMSLNRATSIPAIADATATWIRRLTGFDRVMTYRFDADWNGEVIAEDRRDDLNTFLGLHYPSTDIPAQARELYRRNWLRVIPDISYEPVAIVPDDVTPSGEYLDLSDSTIRSVSPIHVEYLSNMGVTASMSVSIIVDDELWGLIACHHYSGVLRPPPVVRSAAEYIGQLSSVRVRETVRNDERQHSLESSAIVGALGDAFVSAHAESLSTILHGREADVLKVAGASGALVRAGDEEIALGVVPPPTVVDAVLAEWPEADDVFATDHSGDVADVARAHAHEAAGVLAVAPVGDRRDAVVWFRPERVHAVTWAGDPYEKELATETPGARLSPRRSFDLWREVVRGRSEPWRSVDIAAATRFAQVLGTSVLRRERETLAVARDMQRIMLPATLPEVAGFDVDAHCLPDGHGRVGGDWYDALAVADRVVFVVGDVAGHGIVASATMTQARNVFRAYVADGAPVHEAIERLDRFVRTTMPGEMLSMIAVELDPAAGTCTICRAGHPPAMQHADDGALVVDAPTNRLVGVVAGPFVATSVPIGPGETMVLFSDGLVEARHRPFEEGLDLLRREIERVGDGPLVGFCERLSSAMAGSTTDDDVTVLAIRADR